MPELCGSRNLWQYHSSKVMSYCIKGDWTFNFWPRISGGLGDPKSCISGSLPYKIFFYEKLSLKLCKAINNKKENLKQQNLIKSERRKVSVPVFPGSPESQVMWVLLHTEGKLLVFELCHGLSFQGLWEQNSRQAVPEAGSSDSAPQKLPVATPDCKFQALTIQNVHKSIAGTCSAAQMCCQTHWEVSCLIWCSTIPDKIKPGVLYLLTVQLP